MQHTRYIPALMGASLCVTGCVSSSTTQLIGHYSSAAGNLDSTVGKTYTEVRQIESDNRIASALNDPDTGYNSFCKEPLKIDSISARTKLADELLGYSRSLQLLISDQSEIELTAQSQVLFANLSSLNSTLGSLAGKPPLTKSDLALVAAAVDAIGQAWIRSERLKLLTQIVGQADPLIQQATQLYLQDLENWQDFEMTALENISRNYFKLAQTKTFPDAGTRMTLLQKSDAARNQAESVSSKFQSLREAMQNCAQAHGAVLASLKSDAELKNSTGVVSNFEISVQQVEAFYQGAAK